MVTTKDGWGFGVGRGVTEQVNRGARKEPKTGLSRVFNFKLGCFGDEHLLIYVAARPHL